MSRQDCWSKLLSLAFRKYVTLFYGDSQYAQCSKVAMIKKTVGLIIVMVILSYLGQIISERLYSFDANNFSSVFDLILSHLPFILLCNLCMYGLDMLRLSLIGKALRIKLTWMDSFGAVAMNVLFGWLSPMAILGAPAMAYFLYKRGYPLAESITASFVRSFSIILVSALSTITIYGFHLQGNVTNVILQEKIFQILSFIAVYIFTLVFLSFYPLAPLKKIKALEKVTSQIRTFLTNGKFYLLPILLVTLVNNFLLVSFIPYTTAHYFKEFSEIISQTMLFLSYMLLMPTPGASGLAEVGAPQFFQGVIPVQETVTTVMAMRVSTISLQIAVGIVFMIFFMKSGLSFTELQKFKEENKK